MRRYIRHPSNVPISYNTKDHKEQPEILRDVSSGGLCFTSDIHLHPGHPIHIEIPVSEPPFQADGVIKWCRCEGNHYVVGVAFNEITNLFALRMVEQLCHIEGYRQQVQEQEQRNLTSEEAAAEWIEKYAADFPSESSMTG